MGAMDESNPGVVTPEFLCPACGNSLTGEERTENGWNCRCGDFIPKGLEINPYKGCSNQHKQNCSWR